MGLFLRFLGAPTPPRTTSPLSKLFAGRQARPDQADMPAHGQVVFSLGFASVLVVVGVVAAQVGQLVLTWLSSRWIGWVQIGAALLIVGVGFFLTANAWRTVAMVG